MIKIAAVQCQLSDNEFENIKKLERFVRTAASEGARAVLLPELFQGHYFCSSVDKKHFARAKPLEESKSVKFFQSLSEELKLFIPVSYFEKDGNSYFNSLAALDCGKLMGNYRKSHIPEGPGYEEKEYFQEGNTGFKVWDLGDIKIGTAICWDQWFPEAARAMTIMGADVLFYPTAIGSEPLEKTDTSKRWQRVMQGHAVANACPVLTANRIGNEGLLDFYGNSFYANEEGELLSCLGVHEEGLVRAEVDVAALKAYRKEWPFLKHRRPDLYSILTKERPE